VVSLPRSTGGWARLPTIDIAVSTKDANVERLNLALASLGAGIGTVGADGLDRSGRVAVVGGGGGEEAVGPVLGELA